MRPTKPCFRHVLCDLGSFFLDFSPSSLCVLPCSITLVRVECQRIKSHTLRHVAARDRGIPHVRKDLPQSRQRRAGHQSPCPKWPSPQMSIRNPGLFVVGERAWYRPVRHIDGMCLGIADFASRGNVCLLPTGDGHCLSNVLVRALTLRENQPTMPHCHRTVSLPGGHWPILWMLGGQ